MAPTPKTAAGVTNPNLNPIPNKGCGQAISDRSLLKGLEGPLLAVDYPRRRQLIDALSGKGKEEGQTRSQQRIYI